MTITEEINQLLGSVQYAQGSHSGEAFRLGLGLGNRYSMGLLGLTQKKLQVTQELLDVDRKHLAEVRAILTRGGPADYQTPVAELARRVVDLIVIAAPNEAKD